MARRSAQAEENHWPGFVDALSTIVMVVTFLLIILAIVIFVLSQSIAKSYIESLAPQTEAGGGDVDSPDPLTATREFMADRETEGASATASAGSGPANATQDPDAPVEAAAQSSGAQDATATTDDSFSTALADLTSSDIPEVSGVDLAVRSRRVLDEEERISVQSPDALQDQGQARVTQAATILTLAFDESTTRIDDAARERIGEFLARNAEAIRTETVTIWAFTDQSMNSVSQARRIAYYRALAARNELQGSSLTQDRIVVEIRPSPAEDMNNTVQVVVRQ